MTTVKSKINPAFAAELNCISVNTNPGTMIAIYRLRWFWRIRLGQAIVNAENTAHFSKPVMLKKGGRYEMVLFNHEERGQ